MSRDERRTRTQAYGALQTELAAILYGDDPGGMGSSVGAPEDE
jgi:hypothetical protein